MKSRTLLVLGLALLPIPLLECDEKEDDQSGGSTAQINGTIVDGLDGAPLADGILVIRGEMSDTFGRSRSRPEKDCGSNLW